MIYALPTTLKTVHIVKDISPAAAVLVSASFEIPGVFLALLLGNTVGRRMNIAFAFSAITLCLGGVIYAVFMEKMLTVGLWSTFMVKMFIASGFIIVYLYLLECYPTNFRATGLAFCMVVGRMGAFFCPFIYDGFELIEISRGYFFVGMAMMCATGSFMCFWLPIETKDAPLPEE